jgi:serine/threonine protein kinase
MPFRWVALESLENLRFCSKTDVWSFGILLWEIFTRGVIPYREIESLKELKHYLQQTCKCEMGVEKPLRLLRPPFLHNETWSIIESTWMKDPKYRPDFSNLRYNLEQQQKILRNWNKDIQNDYSDHKATIFQIESKDYGSNNYLIITSNMNFNFNGTLLH